MHPLEGICMLPWPAIPLHSMVPAHSHFLQNMSYYLITIKVAERRVPLGVGVGLVKEACIYLLTDTPDFVWHHPSVVNTTYSTSNSQIYDPDWGTNNPPKRQCQDWFLAYNVKWFGHNVVLPHSVKCLYHDNVILCCGNGFEHIQHLE